MRMPVALETNRCHCKMIMDCIYCARAAAFVQKSAIVSIFRVYSSCLHAYSRKALYVAPKTLPERAPRLHNRC